MAYDQIAIRVGNYAISQTIGGDFLLVDASEENAPVARFTCETDARHFWGFFLDLILRPDANV